MRERPDLPRGDDGRIPLLLKGVSRAVEALAAEEGVGAQEDEDDERAPQDLRRRRLGRDRRHRAARRHLLHRRDEAARERRVDAGGVDGHAGAPKNAVKRSGGFCAPTFVTTCRRLGHYSWPPTYVLQPPQVKRLLLREDRRVDRPPVLHFERPSLDQLIEDAHVLLDHVSKGIVRRHHRQ